MTTVNICVITDGVSGPILLLSATPEAGEEECRVCGEKVTGKPAQAPGRARGFLLSLFRKRSTVPLIASWNSQRALSGPQGAASLTPLVLKKSAQASAPCCEGMFPGAMPGPVPRLSKHQLRAS